MTARRKPWSDVFEFLADLQELSRLEELRGLRAGGWVLLSNGCIRRPRPGVTLRDAEDNHDVCDCPASALLGVELAGVDEMWAAALGEPVPNPGQLPDAYTLLTAIVAAADCDLDAYALGPLPLREMMLRLLGLAPADWRGYQKLVPR